MTTTITPTRIAKPRHGSEEWLRLRWRDADGRCTFGASDAPALMGASPYTTRADLYLDKRVDPVMEEEKPVFRRGNVLEPALLDEASHLLGVRVATPRVMYRAGRFTISMDGVDDEERPTIAVEAKTTARYTVHDADDLPMEWRWQGWAQQSVLGVPVWFIVLDRDLRITMVELPRRDDAIAALWDEAERFGAMVDAGTPADADINQFSADQIARLWPASPEPVALPDSARAALDELRAARTARREAEGRESDARDAIARMLLGHEVGLLDGERAVTWRSQPGRASLDARRLREELPEVYERYLTRGEPYRVLRVA
ncbi:MAG: YqaJ viral recombinase family protein [Ilumatobacteraceae bacterium]|jgi:predicted phage-related endonuclease